MPALPVITAVGGLALQAKGQSDARKAANQALSQPAPTVDINALDRQAREFALRNAAEGAALERQYNPGAAELRAGGLSALLDSLNPDARQEEIVARIMSQAGDPLTAYTFDSPLTREAIEAARADLALGGAIPLDVQQQVARRAFERSGSVSGGLGLGRDISARDLGLTSLDLRNQRLARAASIGAQEAALERENAGIRSAAEAYGRGNLLQSGDFLTRVLSGDYAKALAAAQLGQNISMPETGLDPGTVANIAVGNSNALAQKQQQDAATRAARAAQTSQFGSQLIGAGLGMFGQSTAPKTTYGPVSTTRATGGNYYPNWFQPSATPSGPYPMT